MVERSARLAESPANQPFETFDAVYSGDVYNCGLAHGVPAPLALLSIAYSKGVLRTGSG
ncbi:hypothetical protein [Kribbella sp. NPDC051718]|uniref:hypothetical protein n=1 Tax=Kribbella sp. NPDC051718 TaxID=3155168 RepID=UPI00343E559D